MLSYAVRLAAYNDARLEEPCELASDICADPETGARSCEHPDAKTEAGDRYVPIHSQIAALIKMLTKAAKESGYLIVD